ncbi:MAG: hypothetical protein V9G12_03885 [Microthrixaceae bacterium]
MAASDNAFEQLEQIAIRANDLILRGLNDSLSGSERAISLGSEMKDLINSAVEIGNTSVNGQYIFSGYQVNQKAFALSDSPTTLPDYQGNPFTPKTVAYLGDTGNMQRNLGPDQSVTLNVRGDQAILGFLQNLDSGIQCADTEQHQRYRQPGHRSAYLAILVDWIKIIAGYAGSVPNLKRRADAPG